MRISLNFRFYSRFNEDTSLLLKLALPIFGSSLLQTTYNLTDIFWVGHISTNAVASVGTATFFINLGWAISSLIVMGVGVKISHAVGKRNNEEAARYAMVGIYGIIALALAYSILLFTQAYRLINFFRLQNSSVVQDAVFYMRVASGGIILTLFNFLLTAIVSAHGFTVLALKASLTGTLTNIVLDPLLIFVFHQGVAGAAYATILARAASILVFFFLISKYKQIYFSRKNLLWQHWQKVLRIGLPTALQRSSFIVIYIFIGRIVAEWGASAIAVQRIGLHIESLSFMFTGGLSQAMAIAVGQQYGAGNLKRVQGIFNKGLALAFLIGGVGTLLFLSVPERLFSLFLHDKESIGMGADYLRILAISQIFVALEMISAGAFNGLGKTKFPAFISIVFSSLRIPFAYFFGFYTALNLDGVWWSISGSSIVKGVLLYLMFKIIYQKVAGKKQTALANNNAQI